MKCKTEVKYLENIISNDGSCDKTINDRWNKGIGIINSVITLINNISLGQHYFKIGLLFRETNIINGIMTSIEVMHNITKKQVSKLENIDEIYLRKLLRAPVTTAIEALFIETGKIPLGIILKMRHF